MPLVSGWQVLEGFSVQPEPGPGSYRCARGVASGFALPCFETAAPRRRAVRDLSRSHLLSRMGRRSRLDCNAES